VWRLVHRYLLPFLIEERAMKICRPILRAPMRRSLALLAVAVAANLLAASTAEAVNLYRETFGTETVGGQGAALGYDWAVHVNNATSTALDQSANTSTVVAINRNANASKPGMTDTIGQVNAGPVVGNVPAAYGAGVAFATVANTSVIFWTPEYPARTSTTGIDPATHPGLTFSWYQGNANTDGSWRVAIRQNNQWYVTQQTFTNTAAVTNVANFGMGGDDGEGGTAHGSELKSFTYSNDATAWFSLTFDGTFTLGTEPGVGGMGTSGTVLALGTQPGSNLTGMIDAFGMFSDVPGAAGNRRFDTYTISDSLAPLALTGDYNSNLKVDAADYIVWREAVAAGATTLTNRDPAISGVVGTADYNSWRANFGNPPGSGSSLGGSAAVPEPGSILLLLVGLVGVRLRRQTGGRPARRTGRGRCLGNMAI
jgi:PEP-CTERM motif